MYKAQAHIHLSLIRAAEFVRSPAFVHLTIIILVAVAFGIVSQDALAQTTTMPWQGPICAVAKSLAGPTAKAIAVIAVVISGLMLAFAELGGVFKTFMGLLIGISMALMAANWVGFIDGSGGAFCN